MKKAASDEKVKYWQEVVNEWQKSQLPQQRFCEERQINFNQFKNWRYQLKRSTQDNEISNFIPITVVSDMVSDEEKLNGIIELHLTDGKKLILRDDYAKTVFDKLVSILHV